MDSNKTILLVEDSDRDTELIRMALSEQKMPVLVERVCDGVEAMEYLYEKNRSTKNIALVLLDIKLPRMNGIETLSKIKTSEHLKSIPVVMLTSSREERDILACYSAGANAYVVKPLEFKKLFETLRIIASFWCSVNEMPG